MALTYTAIATVTVGSGGAANIVFDNISASYTDLLLYLSGRSDRASTDGDNWTLALNDSTSNFTYRLLYGDGSAAASINGTNSNSPYLSSANQTASTFGNVLAYIPNYAGSNNKSISVDGVSETNATTAYMGLSALLWSNSAAITKITLGVANGTKYLQYSTATLYGIKNTV